LTLIVIYIICGLLINKFALKMEGSLFPNVGFWKALPGYFMVWILFFSFLYLFWSLVDSMTFISSYNIIRLSQL